jgi:hypothetical protein
VRDGRLTLPMPERERELRVKRGDVPVMADVLDEIDTVQRKIETRLVRGGTQLGGQPLPAHHCTGRTDRGRAGA